MQQVPLRLQLREDPETVFIQGNIKESNESIPKRDEMNE